MRHLANAAKVMCMGVAMSAACGVAAAQMQGGAAQQPGTQQQQPGATSPNGMNSAADQAAMSGMQQGGMASAQDKSFLRTAAEGGLFEVQAGQLASQKGQSDDVKQFGQMMVTDHTKLNDQLKPFMQQANMQAPTQLHGKEKKEYAKLQGLNGAAFDQQYVKVMTKDHETDLKDFKQEEASAQMPGLKPAVMQGEQVISMHLDKIKQIGSSMGTTGAASSGE